MSASSLLRDSLRMLAQALHRTVPSGNRRHAKDVDVCATLAWAAVLAGTALAVLLIIGSAAFAQSNTRLLLASGTGVPGHSGFVFGPFSDLAMNANREIVFLSELRSARSEIRAVVRSAGVTFSVAAFQGLRAPVPKTAYESFSAPSINDSGAIAFSAALRDGEQTPAFGVIRMEGLNARALATTADTVPGNPEAKFQEFSAPLINAQGNVLFGARWEGKKPGAGLFLWTPREVQALPLPAGLPLAPKDMLEPIFFAADEAVFTVRGTPREAAIEQFFRAVAIRSFQELTPPPDPAETVEVLAARPGEAHVQLLLVLMEGEKVQTALVAGDPSQPVMARRPPGSSAVNPLGQIQGQTAAPRGNIVFAASAAGLPDDLGLHCYCDGQVIRLTTREEFLPIAQAAPGKPILSLAGDGGKTVAFIAPGAGPDAWAIFVSSIP